MERTTDLYYESHVTIDPVFGERREVAQEIGAQFNFKMARLVLRKTSEDAGTVHTDDSFLTGHSINGVDIADRTVSVVQALQNAGFNVRRYKIEDTVCDSRNSDTMNLLGVKNDNS